MSPNAGLLTLLPMTHASWTKCGAEGGEDARISYLLVQLGFFFPGCGVVMPTQQQDQGMSQGMGGKLAKP